VENTTRQLPLFPGMGGTTGGEREATSDRLWSVSSLMVNGEPIYVTYLPGGYPPEQYAPFWGYWLNTEAIEAAVSWCDAVRNTYTRSVNDA